MRDLTRDQLLEELRALRPLLEREGAVGVSLFGSRARGDNRRESDIDLVIDVAKAYPFTALNLAEIYRLIEEHLGLESNLVVLDDYTDAGFVSQVTRELIPVY